MPCTTRNYLFGFKIRSKNPADVISIGKSKKHTCQALLISAFTFFVVSKMQTKFEIVLNLKGKTNNILLQRPTIPDRIIKNQVSRVAIP